MARNNVRMAVLRGELNSLKESYAAFTDIQDVGTIRKNFGKCKSYLYDIFGILDKMYVNNSFEILDGMFGTSDLHSVILCPIKDMDTREEIKPVSIGDCEYVVINNDDGKTIMSGKTKEGVYFTGVYDGLSD